MAIINGRARVGVRVVVGPSAPSVDADAQAFITAAGITNPTQQTAINTLVVDLKGYGIWTKMKALYPFVGGTASAHKFNLKDPRDLDAAFRLVFSGGVTHGSTGITFNGINGYADTFLIPSVVTASQNSLGMSFYSRTNNAVDFICDMGCWNYIGGVAKAVHIFNRTASNTSLLRIATSGFAGNSGAVSNSSGFFTGNRTSSSSQKLFRNGKYTTYRSLQY
jgi:hypothetical protein